MLTLTVSNHHLNTNELCLFWPGDKWLGCNTADVGWESLGSSPQSEIARHLLGNSLKNNAWIEEEKEGRAEGEVGEQCSCHKVGRWLPSSPLAKTSALWVGQGVFHYIPMLTGYWTQAALGKCVTLVKVTFYSWKQLQSGLRTEVGALSRHTPSNCRFMPFNFKGGIWAFWHNMHYISATRITDFFHLPS